MSILLLAALESSDNSAGNTDLTQAQVLLKQMVLDSVTSLNTRRSYALTLDELFAFSAGRSLTRALLHEWKSLDGWAGAIDCQCKAFSRSETCRRGPAQWADLGRGCG